MVGTPTKWNKIQLSVTVYPEHIRLIEKILNKEYNRPVAHESASEIVRRAIEHYADYLGVKNQK